MTELLEILKERLSPIVGGNIHTIDATDTTKPPYIVLTPIDDSYSFHADDTPQSWTEDVLISIYTVENYRELAEDVCKACIDAGCTITERRFIERESKTKYFHYAVTVEKEFEGCSIGKDRT